LLRRLQILIAVCGVVSSSSARMSPICCWPGSRRASASSACAWPWAPAALPIARPVAHREFFLLAGLAAVMGLLLSLWMGQALGSLLPPTSLPITLDVHWNLRILAFTLISVSLRY